MFKSAPTDATRLFIVLVEDDGDTSLFWSALWDRSKNEVWRSDHALIAVDAIEVARVARKEIAARGLAPSAANPSVFTPEDLLVAELKLKQRKLEVINELADKIKLALPLVVNKIAGSPVIKEPQSEIEFAAQAFVQSLTPSDLDKIRESGVEKNALILLGNLLEASVRAVSKTA